ncbi:hypothetical protein PDJAM_G00118950 [Pangasius djambal]|uniref:Uncharacterized protein n=1 Tax=Pangasius djambal TaxID=1691987 RepID=A0ACC5Z8T2_9TELE|nr:hypothetical protein [Pangasius djambal]
MAEVVELHKLKLAELKQECALRGLEVKGNKGDLIARLQAYIDEHGRHPKKLLKSAFLNRLMRDCRKEQSALIFLRPQRARRPHVLQGLDCQQHQRPPKEPLLFQKQM